MFKIFEYVLNVWGLQVFEISAVDLVECYCRLRKSLQNDNPCEAMSRQNNTI